MEKEIKALTSLKSFIEYLKQTKDSEWYVGKVRSEDEKKNCMFGHLVNWYYGNDYRGGVSPIWDIFEEVWATTYMVYPVNDGQNPRYQQKTAKERVIAYLENLEKGVEKNTQQLMLEEIKAIPR